MNQRGWKHFGTRSLPKNTYYQKERAESKEYVGRTWPARVIASVFGVIAVALTLLYNPFFSLQTVSINGVHSVPPETIRTRVAETLNGRRWYIVPRNNIFFLDRGAIRSAIQEFLIPESIAITPEWGNILSIQINEFPVVLYWKEGNNRYSINQHGFITEQIPNSYIVPLGSVIVEDAGRTMTIGGQVMDVQQVRWVLDSAKLLKDQFHLQPVSVVVSRTVPDIVEIRLEYITLTMTYNDTPQAQISRLKVLVDTKPALLTDKARHTIDLRFGEKVYYH